jgi:hypothetical protein
MLDTKTSSAIKIRTLLTITLLLFSTEIFSNDSEVSGKISELIGTESGVYIRLDSPRPKTCRKASSDQLLILPDALPMVTIASTAQNRKVTVLADYSETLMACIVRYISIANRL